MKDQRNLNQEEFDKIDDAVSAMNHIFDMFKPDAAMGLTAMTSFVAMCMYKTVEDGGEDGFFDILVRRAKEEYETIKSINEKKDNILKSKKKFAH